jgi:hypothetical protein
MEVEFCVKIMNINCQRSLPARRDQHGKNNSQEEAQTANSVVHLCPRREPRTKLTVKE